MFSLRNLFSNPPTKPVDSDLIKEVAFVVNLVKNGMTVKTGDYEALTRIFTGQKMYVDTRDISVAPHVMLDGVWETNLVQTFRSFVKPDSVVFDIGANFGFYGVTASTNNPQGSTHFFEANPELIPYIRKSLAINGLTGRSAVNNVAITSVSSGSSEIHVYQDYWGSATLHAIPEDRTYKSHTVPNTTIDGYCTEHAIDRVDVVKMDIEGYEDHALRGMKKTIQNNPQLKLFLEFTAASYPDAQKFYKEIRRQFDIIHIVHEGSGERSPVNSFDDLLPYSNDWVMLYLTNEE